MYSLPVIEVQPQLSLIWVSFRFGIEFGPFMVKAKVNCFIYIIFVIHVEADAITFQEGQVKGLRLHIVFIYVFLYVVCTHMYIYFIFLVRYPLYFFPSFVWTHLTIFKPIFLDSLWICLLKFDLIVVSFQIMFSRL